jgi:hypothetical protein
MTVYRYFETQERDGVQILYLADVGSDGCGRDIPDETRGNQGDCLAKGC